MDYSIIAFWLFLAVTAVCVTCIAHLNRLASERTIREAIEKGAVKDAEGIHRLRGEAGIAWYLKLVMFGFVFTFLGMALAVLGMVLFFMEPDTLIPLLASGAFGVVFGIGLIVTGAFLRKLEGPASR